LTSSLPHDMYGLYPRCITCEMLQLNLSQFLLEAPQMCLLFGIPGPERLAFAPQIGGLLDWMLIFKRMIS
jgi:hypothetical protein